MASTTKQEAETTSTGQGVKYCTMREAVERYGGRFSRSFLQKKINEGKIKSLKLSERKRWVDVISLDTWVASCEAIPQAD